MESLLHAIDEQWVILFYILCSVIVMLLSRSRD